MSRTSDTDVRLFLQLANPNVTTPVTQRSPVLEEEDEDDEDAPGGYDEFDDEGEGYDGSMDGDIESSHPRITNGAAEDGDVEEDEEEEGEEEEVPLDGHSERYGGDAMEPSTHKILSAPIEMDAASLEIEKQSALLEIERLKAQGVKITKEYSLNDDLGLIQWEIRKQLMLIDESNSVSFMKDAMRLGFSGIEALNGKVKILELEGWAAQASTELSGHKYDNALSKLYRKYWKRGSSSPEMEIAFGLLGSIGSYHFKKKMLSSRPAPMRSRGNISTVDDSDDEDVPP